MTMAGPRVELFGVPIDAITLAQALARIEEAIARGERLHVGVVNAAKLVGMRRDPLLREDVLQSELILADGMSVVWASRLLGGRHGRLPERVTGIDLMYGIFERGAECGWRVYLLGASEEVNARCAARLARDYPGLILAGRHHGYFRAHEEARLVRAIATARAQILLVGMPTPRKERFLARWREELAVNVLHGVGGSFDVFAGLVERAPATWQRLGLEWLYRLKQEPRRLWRRYLVTNTLFCGMLLAEGGRRLLARPARVRAKT
jgi:N-acetylglucosaminyldiphosphoundecaprenol N-acetyl-beta-D-mannosaminyltransferase